MFRRLALTLLVLSALHTGCAEEATLTRTVGSPTAPPEYRGEDPLAGDDDDETSGDDDGTDTVEIMSLEPAPGSDTHHYRSPLLVRFTGNATGFDVSVRGPEQSYVPSDVVWNTEHTQATVWPRPRLTPDTAYEVTVAAGSLQQTWAFRTSRIGLLDVDTSSLDGAVFLLDPSSAVVVAPAALSIASTTFQGRPLVRFGVLESAALELTVGLGQPDGDAWSQDRCAPTASVQSDESLTLEGALFGTTGSLITVPLGGLEIALEDGWIEGDVTPDGEGLVAVGVSGFAPAASLASLLGVGDACALAESQLGAACVACPSGVGECLWIDVAGLSGQRWDLDLTAVGAADLSDCVDGPSGLVGCSAAGDGAPQSLVLGALAACLLRKVRRRLR